MMIIKMITTSQQWLPAAAGAVGGGEGGAALLGVPGYVTILTGAAHTHSVDAGRVPVTVAVKSDESKWQILNIFYQLSSNLPPLPLAHT